MAFRHDMAMLSNQTLQEFCNSYYRMDLEMDEARMCLVEAMKSADREEDGLVHRKLAELVSDLDDLRAIVVERYE